MEGFQHDADDHLFEKELIRMCIDQLLEEDDELETSTEEIFSSQKAKNMHYNSPIYQVIGQKPKRDATHGKSNTYAKVLSGNYKNNMVSFCFVCCAFDSFVSCQIHFHRSGVRAFSFDVFYLTAPLDFFFFFLLS